MVSVAIGRQRIEPAPREQARDRFARACEGVLERWHGTRPLPPEPGPQVGRWEQWRAAREARLLVEALAHEIAECPPQGLEREAWKERVEQRVRGYGERWLGWPSSYREMVLGDGFYRSSLEFVRQARKLDPDLRFEDLLQALRNVWIANSLQLLLGLPVACTHSLYAYSLLYPVTDNYLDDPAVADAAKVAFNMGLAARLRGETPRAVDSRESVAFDLVAQIEADWPRQRWPEVWESLLAIHRAQEESLLQQGSREVSRQQLLSLSIAKGAASVWADAALVAGRLDEGALRFAVGYGFALQLLDDLQDARSDHAAGHRTLFSTALERGPVDDLVARLYHFVAAVIDDDPRFAAPELDGVRDLIRRNCVSLLIGAVAQDPALCSPRFVRRLERRWPLGFAAQRRLAGLARRRWSQANAVLEERFGCSSLLDLLATELEPPQGGVDLEG
jgi:hypothetical protein